jgi:hypothetical protein
VSDGRIADDEVLYRRIPPGESWFQPPGRITSGNFKLRPDELGISVCRAVAVDVVAALSEPQAKSGWRVAETTAGKIRASRDGKDNLLGLDVVAVNDENNPGHAEIRGRALCENPKVAAKALREQFALVAPPPKNPAGTGITPR